MFLGGVITEWISWPWVFYINIPIALLVLAVTPGLMPSAPARRGSIDFAGAITATAGLALTVFGVVRAPEEGWGSATTLLTIAGGLVLLAVFVAIQATRREPLVRLGIFRTPNLAAANLAQVLLGAAWIPMWFFLNLYLQQVLGYGAFEGGAALLPMTAAIMLGMVVVAPKVIARLGVKVPDRHRPAAPRHGHGDPVAGAAGRLVRRRRPARVADRRRRHVACLHPDARHGDPVRQAGGGRARLGIVNTSYQVGSALGLAAMTALASAYGADQLGDAVALTDGYSAAFLGAAGIALVGALAAAALLRTPKPAAAEAAGAEADASVSV